MPVVKVQFKPGINREVTDFANEGGFYNGNKIRFRSGYPEKLGGWVNYSPKYSFNGVTRTMYCWVDYSDNNLLAFGTNQQYYVELGGVYHDVTPVRYVSNPENPFTATSGSNIVLVTDPGHGAFAGDYVVYTSTSNFGTINFNGTFEVISVVSSSQYYILAPNNSNATGTGGGTVVATYEINSGAAIGTTGTGWGIVPWGHGGWGSAAPSAIPLRFWSQVNYNQDLIAAYYQGPIYYWTNNSAFNPMVQLGYQASGGNGTYATNSSSPWVKTIVLGSGVVLNGTNQITVPLTQIAFIDPGSYVFGTGITPGTYVVTVAYGSATTLLLSQATAASGDTNNYYFTYAGPTVPSETFQVVTSSTYGFTIAMGSTPYNPISFNQQFAPLLVRWSDQSNALEWTPTNFNQSGEQSLSNGSYIVGSVNTRQEILIWTDTSLYSMQYIGPPYVFGFTSLMDNISTISPNCMVTIQGVTYWMGVDKFFVYSGRVDTLPCSVRKFIFTNLNFSQGFQVVCGYNEGFNEIWWLYPSNNSSVNDSYVIYNYGENTWYYGSLNRTAWFDSPLRPYPMAAFSVQTSYLNGSINSTVTSLPLLNGTTYPPSGGIVTIDNEQIYYSGVLGNILTGCTRGYNGTTAASHNNYAKVYYYIPNQILYHENGVDDLSPSQSVYPNGQPISAYVETSDFDIGDGDHFAYVWRMLPDVTFYGSTTSNPLVSMTVKPRYNSGSQYIPGVYGTDGHVISGIDNPSVIGTVPPPIPPNSYPVEQFTGEVYTRVRGRQMAFRICSYNLGVAWQLGAMRLDIRPDGRR